ncbi:MAG: hypothetical protein A2087_10490 [Spirochaetes bacterium GWD1_61_31]|nr:MAG: hypothetical protein A2Y37_12025 [Spirochaetes bacterium GWB1_60_80]OHD34641.1 MAG: hypothetical protein A2087_10490 [Spirochaetes bacterium GWD1_61_31]OHD46457.1 MAG: hypothetical protein A2Y35_10395 [Spirochaetes bacterium GWE1_60_18]OHD59512.1 MAG: hypothetical protein A2Y32_10350 [Spirochaetes bacterium GWF1_60_12]HCQ86469.1 hypothetical protein [Spirochaetaceae bacterium]
MERAIFILGAGVMQGPAIRTARQRGYQVVVADGNPAAPLAGQADRFVRVDLKDIDGLIAAAASIPNLAGVFTAGTDFSVAVASIAAALRLPGLPVEAARRASDKALMRQCLQQAGVPVPCFATGTLESDPMELKERLATEKLAAGQPAVYPLVVKPVDNMGGRGCRLVGCDSELLAAWLDAAANSRSGRVIVEDYVDGPEFSIDALVHDGRLVPRGLADRLIRFSPYFIEMGHTMPSAYAPEIQQELLAVFERAVKALGITNGAAKGDVKYTRQGPVIGEIAARLSGGYMSGWTYPYASGINPADDAIAIACGQPPSFPAESLGLVCAERAFISIPGTVAKLHRLTEASNLPGVRDVFSRVNPGDRVVFPRNNVQKCGNVLAVDVSRNGADAMAEAAARSILIQLQPADAETDRFLSLYNQGPVPGVEYPWPPQAFPDISALRLGLVAAMPDFVRRNLPAATLAIAPLANLEGEAGTDWQGRSLAESLEAVRLITAVSLGTEADLVLGRRFWQALFQAGYQAAAYVVDSVKQEYRLR